MAEKRVSEEEPKPKRWVAVARCFINDQIYEAGEEFIYDGPQGRAFKPVGGEPMEPLDLDRAIFETERSAVGGVTRLINRLKPSSKSEA